MGRPPAETSKERMHSFSALWQSCLTLSISHQPPHQSLSALLVKRNRSLHLHPEQLGQLDGHSTLSLSTSTAKEVASNVTWGRGADLVPLCPLPQNLSLFFNSMPESPIRQAGPPPIICDLWISTQFCSLPVPFFLMDMSGARAGSLTPRIHHPHWGLICPALEAQVGRKSWLSCYKRQRHLGLVMYVQLAANQEEKKRQMMQAAIMLQTKVTCLWILRHNIFFTLYNGKTWEKKLN